MPPIPERIIDYQTQYWAEQRRRIRRDRIIGSAALVVLWLASVLIMASIIHHATH